MSNETITCIAPLSRYLEANWSQSSNQSQKKNVSYSFSYVFKSLSYFNIEKQLHASQQTHR